MEPSPAKTDRLFRFGQFELSEREGVLRKSGTRIKLQEQPFRVLLELVANSGRMVTREELQQKIWPADTFVDFDTGLNTAIRKIRQALGDDADNPLYIETTPRRGYRFLMPVSDTSETARMTESAPAVVPPVPPTPKRLNRQKYVYAAALLAVAALLSMLLWPRHAQSVAYKERRITSNPVEVPIRAAVISPDGKFLAYADPVGVYVREIETGEVRPLQLPPDSRVSPDSWYPDSTHLLVSGVSLHKGTPNIWKISILGGSAELLVEDGERASLSHDGKRMAFFRGSPETVPYSGQSPTQLWLADADGGNAAMIAQAGISPDASRCVGDIRAVAWSPTATRLAYIESGCVSPTAAPPSIRIREVTTGEDHVLLAGKNVGTAMAWTRDGQLVFEEVGKDPGDDRALASVGVDENSGRTMGAEQRTVVARGRITAISVTDDGRRFAILRDNRDAQAFVAEVDPKTGDLGDPRRLTFDENSNQPRAWMPDSQSVIFQSDRSGEWKIYRQGLQDTVPEVLVAEGNAFLARLSADGAYLLYLHVPPDAKPGAPVDVMRLSISDRSRQRLFSVKDLYNMQCAQAPARLCLYSTASWLEKKTYFFSFDPASGQRQAVLTVDNSPKNWTLSPDGRTLAFLDGEAQTIRLYDFAERTWRELQVSSWHSMHSIDWSQNGRLLIIPAYDSKSQPVLLGVATNGTARVLRTAEKQADFVFLIPSPDGRLAAIMMVVGESNAWLRER